MTGSCGEGGSLRVFAGGRFPLIGVAIAVTAVSVALPAAGNARTGAAPCVAGPCQYAIQVLVEYTITDQAKVSVVARFPRVALSKTRSLKFLTGGNVGRPVGSVSGHVAYRAEDCVHERTYTAPARLYISASLPSKRRASLSVDFASPSEVAPQWAETCPRFRDTNTSLGDAIAGGTLLRTATRLWHAAVGSSAQTLQGADSLAGLYDLRMSRRPGSLPPPFRQLWAGRSAVVREHREQRGLGRFDVRITFTRR